MFTYAELFKQLLAMSSDKCTKEVMLYDPAVGQMIPIKSFLVKMPENDPASDAVPEDQPVFIAKYDPDMD